MEAKRIRPAYSNSYLRMNASFKMPAIGLLGLLTAAGCDSASAQKTTISTAPVTPVLPADLFPIKSAYPMAELPKRFSIIDDDADPEPAVHYNVMVPLSWVQLK